MPPLIIFDPIYRGASLGQPVYKANVHVSAPKLAIDETIPVAEATATSPWFEFAVHAMVYEGVQVNRGPAPMCGLWLEGLTSGTVG